MTGLGHGGPHPLMLTLLQACTKSAKCPGWGGRCGSCGVVSGSPSPRPGPVLGLSLAAEDTGRGRGGVCGLGAPVLHPLLGAHLGTGVCGLESVTVVPATAVAP